MGSIRGAKRRHAAGSLRGALASIDHRISPLAQVDRHEGDRRKRPRIDLAQSVPQRLVNGGDPAVAGKRQLHPSNATVGRSAKVAAMFAAAAKPSRSGGGAVRPLSVCAEAKQVSTALSRAAQQPLSMCGTQVRMSAPDRPDDPLAWPGRSLKGRIERSAAVIRMAALAQLRCCGRASQQRGPEKRGRRYQIPSLRDHRAGPA